MALFKISKGTADQLLTGNNSRYAKEGSAWFTTDDGKFYIDIAGDGTSTAAVIGTNRIPLNAGQADKLGHTLTIQLNGGTIQTGTNPSMILFDGSATKTVNITPSSISAVNKTGDTMTGFLTLSADPTNAMHAVTKQYLESYASTITIRKWT